MYLNAVMLKTGNVFKLVHLLGMELFKAVERT